MTEAKAGSARRYAFWSIALGILSLALLLASASRVMQALDGPRLDGALVERLIAVVAATVIAALLALVGAVLGVAALGQGRPRPVTGWIGLALGVALLAACVVIGIALARSPAAAEAGQSVAAGLPAL